MKIAIPYENGNVFQHFGKTEIFKLYDTDNRTILCSEILSTNGKGHGELAAFLTSHDVKVLICGGIGAGAQASLAEAGIQLYGGVSGNADELANAFLNGTLRYNPEICCDHHGNGHSDDAKCGEHGCQKHCEGGKSDVGV